MLHMLDTDMASYIIRGRSPSVREKLAAVLPSMICVSVMTRAELLYGLKKLPPEHRLHIAVRRFFKIISSAAPGKPMLPISMPISGVGLSQPDSQSAKWI